MRILLVYPETPDTFWSFKHVLPFVSKRAAFPPLGLLTIAAMLPRHWELKLVDLNVEQLLEGDLHWADFVMLSAMIVHKECVLEIVHRCVQAGKKVIAGGPLFTTGHASFPQIQHFVLGEAEEVIPMLIADIEQGTVKAVYRAAERPDITRVPVPRWDLIHFKRYVAMTAQFSRGCPYDCEFCDIIVMNGRVPRAKTPEQMIAELESLRVAGWKDMVFIFDDNFIGDKNRTRALLREMVVWRARANPKMGFFTEASVNLADDPELCELMVRAGFKKVFVGIETPSLDSLAECRKVQNRSRDLLDTVRRLQNFGLEVMGGFIVGFDADKPDIFKRQFEFIQNSGVVTAMVGLLTALPQTRLYERLTREGRIEAETTGNNTQAWLNFKPKLNREFLIRGYCELMEKLYEPRAYYRRVRNFLRNHNPRGPGLRFSWADFRAFIKALWVLGIRARGRIAYWLFLWETLLCRPRQFRQAMELAILGYHFRYIASSLRGR